MSMMLRHAVDEAFARMAKLYGRQFAGLFEGLGDDEVRDQWTRELGSLPRALDQIAWALKNLPERCPNAIQFRNLCRQAPSPQQIAMDVSTSPVRGPTQAELDGLRALRDGIEFRAPSRQWARDLLGRYDSGDARMSTGALRMAREVAEVDGGERAAVPRETESAITGRTPTAVFLDEIDRFYAEERAP